jgi:phospholipase/carboxylesterase
MSPMAEKDLRQQGRLRSRPVRTPVETAPVGLRSLRSDAAGSAEGYLYVPAGYRTETPAPLVLLLHGAGEDARDGLAQLRGQADDPGIILLALSSRGPTWDSILDRGRYGADIAAIDWALEHTFSRCAVDPTRVAVGGYSDGASYALSLGIANGDLFSHVLAFSPGFLAPTGQRGSPRIFVSHGTQDRWLPIDSCSRRIVPQLERVGYEVRYREFEGGHVVPPGIAREAAFWFTNRN